PSTAPAKRSPYRPDLLAGYTALVTGGGTGMGRAMALAFADHGADVVVASRKKEHLDPVAEEIRKRGRRALAVPVDVRDFARVEALRDEIEREFGALDILVNNAAGNFLAPVSDLSPNGWNAVVNIVLTGTFHVSKAMLPLLEKRAGRASVTNIIATYAYAAAPLVAHSGAAKAGVLNLTRSLALEWAHRGIRVNAIAPGPVDTEGASSHLFPTPEIKDRILSTVPLSRFAEADEIAHAAVYLASDAASYVTGDCLIIDGGLSWSTRFLGE
ncbi:MAG TPA: SDR family oxidoreductase, partial [Candidatus Thermoplasmatota archaeon]|nr:SDR family oxidoreductase [Candidatus Thermoplasmatota archaeon]